MREKANGANRGKTLEGRFTAPLLHLEFQKECIEPIFELEYSVPIKRSDNGISNACGGRGGGREKFLLNSRELSRLTDIRDSAIRLFCTKNSARCN